MPDMSSDDDVKNPLLFDKRIVERNIKKGLITRKDYDKFLKSLADASVKAAPPEEPLPDDDFDDDDDLDEDEDEGANGASA